jgi:signal transduction histidine kinase
MIKLLNRLWRNFSLSQQFAVVAIAVILPGMAVTGWWISKQVGDAVVRNTASAIFISMENLLAPYADEIEASGRLTPGSRARLDTLLAAARTRKSIVSMKIWSKDGTILYSSFPEMIGRRFDLSASFLSAMRGEVAADLESEAHLEDSFERKQGVALLEVYAPLREPDSLRLVAIAEFYANGDQLETDVWSAVKESWLFVCALTALMATLLSGIAVKGGKTIAAQQNQLHLQVTNLSELLASNESLRERLRLANEDVSSVNEMVLQHVGADLHDGPAQKLAYVMMRLSTLRKRLTKPDSMDDLQKIVSDTLGDIRRMSSGLILPELKKASLREAVEMAVKSHESYTGNSVELKLDKKISVSSSLALRTCVYRIVQEGLSNVFKHGKGVHPVVEAGEVAGEFVVMISDDGPGVSQITQGSVKGLGLRGMQARVDALGGGLTLKDKLGGGTVLKAVLPLSEGHYETAAKNDKSTVGG